MVDVYKYLVNNNISSQEVTALYDILIINPELTLAIPTLELTNNNIQNYFQTFEEIVFLNKDLEIHSTLDAIDNKGNNIQTSTKFDESKIYIVIKKDEYLIATNTNNIGIDNTQYSQSINLFLPTNTFGIFKFYTSSDFKNAKLHDIGRLVDGVLDDDNEEPQIISGSPDCTTNPRSLNELSGNYKREQLHAIKFDDMNIIRSYESGFNLPRIELQVVYAFLNGSTGFLDLVYKSYRTHKRDRGNYVSNIELDIASWKYEKYGDTWRGDWFEIDDKGPEVSFNIGVTAKFKIPGTTESSATANATINFKKKDRKMGSVIIEYCDFVDNINGESYKVAGSGSSGFYFRQRIKP